MLSYDERREQRRRFVRRNLAWIVPLGLLLATGVFFGLGHLVVWLWRVTVSDLFGWKAISFWQAWGLMLLSQILFKANVHRSVGGPMHRRRAVCDGEPAAGPAGPAAGA